MQRIEEEEEGKCPFCIFSKEEKDEKCRVKRFSFLNPQIILRKRSRLCSTTDIISMIRVTTKTNINILVLCFTHWPNKTVSYVCLNKTVDDKIQPEGVCTLNCGLWS